MTEAMEIVEAGRQRLKAALEEIGKMSFALAGQAVVVARKALEVESDRETERWGCFEGKKEGQEPHSGGCVMGTSEEDNCSHAYDLVWHGARKEICSFWRKY